MAVLSLMKMNQVTDHSIILTTRKEQGGKDHFNNKERAGRKENKKATISSFENVETMPSHTVRSGHQLSIILHFFGEWHRQIWGIPSDIRCRGTASLAAITPSAGPCGGRGGLRAKHGEARRGYRGWGVVGHKGGL